MVHYHKTYNFTIETECAFKIHKLKGDGVQCTCVKDAEQHNMKTTVCKKMQFFRMHS